MASLYSSKPTNIKIFYFLKNTNFESYRRTIVLPHWELFLCAGKYNLIRNGNDLSRSPATDSPDPARWNNLQSKVWVNGVEIAPPLWEHAGQKGNAEIPLADEGYSYREPEKISLHKGWNDVLIKAPVSTFKGTDWQNPVKWEFTFLPITNN